MHKITISHKPMWDKQGTCYKTIIHMDKKVFDNLQDQWRVNLILNNKEYLQQGKTQPHSFEMEGVVAYLTLTQKEYITNRLKTMNDVELNYKRLINNNNTAIAINKNKTLNN